MNTVFNSKSKKITLIILMLSVLILTGGFLAVNSRSARADEVYVYGDEIVGFDGFLQGSDGGLLIRSANDLFYLAVLTNAGFEDGFESEVFLLADDIDLSEFSDGEGFSPIGTAASPFKGTFDGSGKKITGLFINLPESDNIGIFGFIGSGAAVKNLMVFGGITGCNNTGGIAGTNAGTITGCINYSDVSGEDNSGGIAGLNTGEIGDCFNTGKIDGYDAGGIAGKNISLISNTYNTGSVAGRDYAGGIAGLNAGAVTLSYAFCHVLSAEGIDGGVCGISSGTVEYVFYSVTHYGGGTIGAGSAAAYSAGLEEYDIVGENVLADLMFALGDSGKWAKRSTSDGFYFCPELIYFKDNPALSDMSENSVSVSRVITLDETVYEYKGEQCRPVPTVKVGGRTLAETVDYTVDYSNNTDVGGMAQVIITYINYGGTQIKEFIILPKLITIKVDSAKLTYDGTAKRPDISVLDGVIAPDSVGLVFNPVQPPVNAGNYSVKVSSDNLNYAVNSSASTVSYTIHKSVISISGVVFEDGIFMYDGNIHAISASNFDDKLDVKYTFTQGGKPVIPKDAGTYRVTAEFKVNDAHKGNYELSANSVFAWLTVTSTVPPVLPEGSGIMFDISQLGPMPNVSFEVVRTEGPRPAVSDKIKILAAYNVKMKKGNDEIQPNGKVTVTVKMDEAMKKAKSLKVVFIDDNGKISDEIIECTITPDGYIIFDVTHFSLYAIITDITSMSLILILSFSGVLVLLLIAMVIIYILRMRNQPIIKKAAEKKGEKREYTEEELTNKQFEYSGIKCASFASFVESLKFEKPSAQARVCALPSAEAVKKASSKEDGGVVFFKGEAIKINSARYNELIADVKKAMNK